MYAPYAIAYIDPFALCVCDGDDIMCIPHIRARSVLCMCREREKTRGMRDVGLYMPCISDLCVCALLIVIIPIFNFPKRYRGGNERKV